MTVVMALEDAEELDDGVSLIGGGRERALLAKREHGRLPVLDGGALCGGAWPVVSVQDSVGDCRELDVAQGESAVAVDVHLAVVAADGEMASWKRNGWKRVCDEESALDGTCEQIADLDIVLR